MTSLGARCAVVAAPAVAPAVKRKLYTLVLLVEKEGQTGAGAGAGAGACAANGNGTGAAAVPAPSSVCLGAVAPLPPPAVAPFPSPYSRMLLGMKKRGFGAGKWNGFGGKIEAGETPRQAAVREMKEEANIESGAEADRAGGAARRGAGRDQPIGLDDTGRAAGAARCLCASSLSKRAVVLQEFEGDPCLLEMHVYLATDYTGTPSESEEMRPQWFPVSSLPFASMWADDEHWHPLILAPDAPRFTAHFLFRGQECLLRHSVARMDAEEQREMERLDHVVCVPVAAAAAAATTEQLQHAPSTCMPAV